MVIPRSWTAIQYQRSPEQANALAVPSGTDARFKAGSFLALLAWCTICYSLRHSIHHYRPRNRGSWNSFRGFWQYCPWKFQLAIPLLLIHIGYAIASSFIWTISPFKFDGNPAWLYGLDIAPALLIILTFEICGFLEPNEDRALIKQRTERGRAADSALGIRHKPNWWSNLSSANQYRTNEQRLRALPTEIGVGGGRPAVTGSMERNQIELSFLSAEQQQALVDDPFRDDAPAPEPDVDVGGYDDASRRKGASSESSSNIVVSPSQQVRSMLDV